MTRDGRAVVGVTPAFDEGFKLPASKATLYLRREYTKLLARLGAVPIILTPDMPLEYIMDFCDGIVISGGEDIPAQIYGGTDFSTVLEPLERTMWELLIIRQCETEQKPLLGVCYGMQLIALNFGGALYTDIATDVQGSIQHLKSQHAVSFQEEFLGFPKGSQQTVASRHHQSVKNLPDIFSLSAVAPDGVIEAMQRGSIYGVQWHPESDKTGEVIYRTFIERCLTR